MKARIINKIIKKKYKEDIVYSGMRVIDEALQGGFKRRKTYLVEGSSLDESFVGMLDVALNMARDDKKVVWISTYMSEEEVTERVIKHELLRKGDEGQDNALATLIKNLTKLPFHIYDRIAPNVKQMIDILVIKDEYLNADAVFVSGIDFVHKEACYKSRIDELEAMFLDIKEAAGFLDLPIIVSVLADGNAFSLERIAMLERLADHVIKAAEILQEELK